MAKLTDADVRRFVGALERGEAAQAQAAPAEEIRPPSAHNGSGEAVCSAIERALCTYLDVELRCSYSANAVIPAHPLCFESKEPERWTLALDAPLAYALSDMMLGGDGKNARPGHPGRLGALLEPLARRILAVAAEAAAQTRDQPWVESLLGGEISCGPTVGNWSIARELRPSGDVVDGRIHPAPEADIVHAHAPAKPETAPAQSRTHERILAAPAVSGSRGPLAHAVEAACANLAEITHREAVVETVRVTLVNSPTLPREDLKLALIAGGQGSLVLSADRAAIAVVADAVAGGHVDGHADRNAEAQAGAVVVDAVETALRAAMRGFAENLPGLASGPQRFVRLAESAMPARSPHFAVLAPVRLDDAVATLAWLVPTWMAEAGEARPPE